MRIDFGPFDETLASRKSIDKPTKTYPKHCAEGATNEHSIDLILWLHMRRETLVSCSHMVFENVETNQT